MEKDRVISYLEKSDFTEVEELKNTDKYFVVRFYYDFDEDELKAAKAYANDECEAEEESDEWFDEFFLPYLNDLAIDNVGDTLEEAMEELDLQIQYVSYEADIENYDYNEIIAVFYEKGEEIEIEDMLDELNL